MQVLVIGAGISGAILARKFADMNHQVLILEKRNHIAGNMYDKLNKGIHVQQYGPHIFHTDKKNVIDYMNNFWTLNNYKNKVNVVINDCKVPIPFNFEGIDTFFKDKKETIKKALIDKFGENSRVSVFELMQSKEPSLKELADFVYENVFKNYTYKMWGKYPKDIDPSVLKRVPVAISYSKNYFSNKYEGIPNNGFTACIKKIIDHPNIKVELDVDANNLLAFNKKEILFKGVTFNGPIIYSGQLDRLFDYKFGVLPYRSLNIVFEKLNQKEFQETAVVNYPAHPTMTRITEYKYFLKDISDHTIISREYPGYFSPDSKEFNEPYYPMATVDANNQYQKYLELTKPFKNFFIIGRLAEYKYLNMDDAIDNALKKFDIIKGIYE